MAERVEPEDLLNELVETAYKLKEHLKSLTPEQVKRAKENINFTNFEYLHLEDGLIIGTNDPHNLHFYLGLHMNPVDYELAVSERYEQYRIFIFDAYSDLAERIYEVIYGKEPNEETIEAMNDTDTKKFETAEEMFEELEKDEDQQS